MRPELTTTVFVTLKRRNAAGEKVPSPRPKAIMAQVYQSEAQARQWVRAIEEQGLYHPMIRPYEKGDRSFDITRPEQHSYKPDGPVLI